MAMHPTLDTIIMSQNARLVGAIPAAWAVAGNPLAGNLKHLILDRCGACMHGAD